MKQAYFGSALHVTYHFMQLIPARTKRLQELRSRKFAYLAQDKLKKSGPLSVGIAVNALIIIILTFVVVTNEIGPENTMKARLEILTPTTDIPQDIGPSALEQATAGSADALFSPASPMPNTLAAITTTAPNPLQFTVAAPTVQAPTLPAIKPGAAQVTGNGNGAGQDSGFGVGNGNGSGQSGNGTGGKIGGMQVNARSLGVLLDDSGSMKPHLNKVRAEIHKSFNGATTQEVQGCAVVYAEDADRPNLDAMRLSLLQ